MPPGTERLYCLSFLPRPEVAGDERLKSYSLHLLEQEMLSDEVTLLLRVSPSFSGRNNNSSHSLALYQ
jgi:hypothetical protein